MYHRRFSVSKRQRREQGKIRYTPMIAVYFMAFVIPAVMTAGFWYAVNYPFVPTPENSGFDLGWILVALCAIVYFTCVIFEWRNTKASIKKLKEAIKNGEKIVGYDHARRHYYPLDENLSMIYPEKKR